MVQSIQTTYSSQENALKSLGLSCMLSLAGLQTASATGRGLGQMLPLNSPIQGRH